jgi:hypothetical protein
MTNEGLRTKDWASKVYDAETSTDMNIPLVAGQVMAGKYTSGLPTFTNGQYGLLRITADGKLMTDAVLETGDIEIGAVELKDGGSDVRATIAVASGTRLPTNNIVCVQLLDSAGTVNAMQGLNAHDAVDTDNPFKIGGKAVSSEPSAVSANDRVNAYFDLNGYQWVKTQGTVAHDGVDSGQPHKIGAYAADPTALPTAVASADRTNICASTQGELLVYNSRLFSGEDQTNNVLAICPKPLAVSTYAYSVDQSAALEASSVTKANAGVLYKIDGRIDSVATTGSYFIQFINAASLPADGAVTMLRSPKKLQHTNGTDSTFSFDFNPGGIYANSGITICLSTTDFTKTIGSAWLSMTALYS